MASHQTLAETTPPPPQLCLPAPPISTPASASLRRIPPPCWSSDETVALIEAYRDKWYTLRRGNLKATHWQEVADEVGLRCSALPGKTAVQCRHKMEKLRKRYRTEIQRAMALPMSVSRFVSNWVHFRLMDDMEKGPIMAKIENGNSESDEDDDNEELYANGGVNMRSIHNLYGNAGNSGNSGSGSSGFKIRIPTGVSVAQPGIRYYGSVQPPKFNMGSGSGFGARVVRDGNVGKRERESERNDALGEMAGAIKMLGDGFVRMEKMKMEMAREIEMRRMEMEMKRTEMILESQERIVEAFANAVADKSAKKMKIVHSPDA